MSYVTMSVSPPQRDFIVQTGDPTGTGRGGESVYRSVICLITVLQFVCYFCFSFFLCDTTAEQIVFCFVFFLLVISKLYGDQARFFDAEKTPRIKHRKKGTVAMVNNGNDQHGSQVNNMKTLIDVFPADAKSF